MSSKCELIAGRYEDYFEGLKVTVDETTGKKSVQARNPEPTFGSNETACWAELGRDPKGNVVRVATGGAASMEGRLSNYIGNGNSWYFNR